MILKIDAVCTIFLCRYRISPFNDTCVGLVHRPACMVAYSFHALDVSLVAFFILGLFLFLSADSLSKNTMLYYGSGIGETILTQRKRIWAPNPLHVQWWLNALIFPPGMGVCMSIIIIMFVFSRFMYKRTGFLLGKAGTRALTIALFLDWFSGSALIINCLIFFHEAVTIGWSGVLYLFALMYDNLASLMETYQVCISVLLFLCFTDCFASIAVCNSFQICKYGFLS